MKAVLNMSLNHKNDFKSVLELISKKRRIQLARKMLSTVPG